MGRRRPCRWIIDAAVDAGDAHSLVGSKWYFVTLALQVQFPFSRICIALYHFYKGLLR